MPARVPHFVNAVLIMPVDLQPWLTIAGTALSGLGATVNGLSSLYGVAGGAGLSSAASGGASGAGIAGGAMALLTGWLGGLKLASLSGSAGTAGAAAGISAIGMGASCAYASIAFLYFMHTVQGMTAPRPPKHAPPDKTPEALLYPIPSWMTSRVLNWAVIGRVGVGKSSLINAIRGLGPRESGAAEVGVVHTTRVPRPYNFVGDVAALTKNMARLWDLPGAGTTDWPYGSYVKDCGLRHFDGVLFVTADSFTEPELEIMCQLVRFRVPYYMVRNKVDQDVKNNYEDHGASAADTLHEIREEMTSMGCDASRTHLLSAKSPESSDYEFAKLLKSMADDVQSQRAALPEFQDPRSCCELFVVQ